MPLSLDLDVRLPKAGIASPSVAVLGRSNGYVSDISLMLGREHTYKQRTLKPLEHHVVWDAELTGRGCPSCGFDP